MISPELNGLAPGLSSMSEKQPQMRCWAQACLNAATSGPSSEHMMAGSVLIDSPCRAYSGNTTRSMVGMLRRALPTMSTMRRVCAASWSGVATTGSWSWTSPITRPLGVLFNPPSALLMSRSFRDAQLARHVAHRALGAGRGGHDDQGEDVGRGVEEVVALGNADRLQRRPDRARRAEQQRRHHAAHRAPARENDQRHRHQALAGREALIPRARIVERQERAADAGEEAADRGREKAHEIDRDAHGARSGRAVAGHAHD